MNFGETLFSNQPKNDYYFKFYILYYRLENYNILYCIDITDHITARGKQHLYKHI